jgi:hypothetical protein
MLTKYAQGRVYNFDQCVGKGMGGGRGFSAGVDFAVSQDGSLYVLNKGHEYQPSTGLTKCTIDHEFLWEDRDFSYGAGLPFPTSVALDSEENVYVSDDYMNKIFVYDKDGNGQGFWPDREPVEQEPYSASDLDFNLYLAKLNGGLNEDGQFNGPSGLAFDCDDNLYVSDSHNHRIQVFAKDGQFLRKFGSHGSEEGQLNLPWGIAVDADRNIYVADWGNDRVQKFSPDGQHLVTFGCTGSADGEIVRPTSVAVDDEGDVYVTDWGNNRVNVYNPDGGFITSFYGDADRLSPSHQAQVDANPDVAKARRRTDLTMERTLARPTAVKVDRQGRIIILESLRSRMQVYVKEKDWLEAQFNL